MTQSELTDIYIEVVGYDPFSEGWTEAEVREILAEFQAENLI